MNGLLKIREFIIIFALCLFALPNDSHAVNSQGMLGKKLPLEYLGVLQENKPLEQKKTIVHFFATWCKLCKADLGTLEEIKKTQDVNVVGVLWQDKIENFQNTGRYNQVYDKVLVDSNSVISFEYGITGVPETFLLSDQGVVMYSNKGSIIAKEVNNALQIRTQ